jgi:type IV secretion system protein VirB9
MRRLSLILLIAPMALADPPPAPDFQPGVPTEVSASPARITDIVLETGEILLSVASGDTSRWTLANAVSGSGGEQRSHVLIRPLEDNLQTNLLILTDRRAYHIELRSTSAPGPAQISWRYPAAPERPRKEHAASPQPDALNFGWRITGDSPPWRPIRAFDDGVRVFIERPAGVREAPPLMILGPEGPELANYRVTDRHYIVETLFETAEMRVGTRAPRTVQIRRTTPP